MKFYIPLIDNRDDAETLWDHVRADLLAVGFETSRRRIRALALHNEGCDHLLHVGDEPPGCAEPVLIILEARDAHLFYVCTAFHGVLRGLPFVLGLNPDSRAIDFEEEVVGPA